MISGRGGWTPLLSSGLLGKPIRAFFGCLRWGERTPMVAIGRPRGGQWTAKGAKGVPKGAQDDPKDSQREAKGTPRDAKGQGEAKRGQREAKGRPKRGQGTPKGGQGEAKRGQGRKGCPTDQKTSLFSLDADLCLSRDIMSYKTTPESTVEAVGTINYTLRWPRATTCMKQIGHCSTRKRAARTNL